MTTGVEFDEDKFSYTAQRHPVSGLSMAGQYKQPGQQVRGIGGWLIRHGFAKSETSAQVLMVCIVILNAIITAFVIKFLL